MFPSTDTYLMRSGQQSNWNFLPKDTNKLALAGLEFTVCSTALFPLDYTCSHFITWIPVTINNGYHNEGQAYEFFNFCTVTSVISNIYVQSMWQIKADKWVTLYWFLFGVNPINHVTRLNLTRFRILYFRFNNYSRVHFDITPKKKKRASKRLREAIKLVVFYR